VVSIFVIAVHVYNLHHHVSCSCMVCINCICIYLYTANSVYVVAGSFLPQLMKWKLWCHRLPDCVYCGLQVSGKAAVI